MLESRLSHRAAVKFSEVRQLVSELFVVFGKSNILSLVQWGHISRFVFKCVLVLLHHGHEVSLLALSRFKTGFEGGRVLGDLRTLDITVLHRSRLQCLVLHAEYLLQVEDLLFVALVHPGNLLRTHARLWQGGIGLLRLFFRSRCFLRAAVVSRDRLDNFAQSLLQFRNVATARLDLVGG